MKLYIARHGESQANVLGVFSNRGFQHPLTEIGVSQSKELAKALLGKSFARVFSSPLLRAIHTTKIITEPLGISEFTISDYLCEYDVGIFEGRSDPYGWQLYAEIEERWKNPDCRHEKIEGGESFEEIQLRFKNFVNKLVEDSDSKDENVLIITHGGLLKVGLPAVMNNISYEFASENVLGNCELIIGNETEDGFICSSWGKMKII